MKIIDLLNKIANDEKVPEKIKVDDKVFYYDETDSDEFYRYRGEFPSELLTDYANLNDEVEIIEEDKKIEKLKEYGSWSEDAESNCIQFLEIKQKINEIIDKINKEG